MSSAATRSAMQRSRLYQQQFNLPEDELLVDEFNCALQQKILLQGKLYISQNFACFYSNIFGNETIKILPASDITGVQLAKILFIPNSIKVFLTYETYFFASFLSRDSAYKLLTRMSRGEPIGHMGIWAHQHTHAEDEGQGQQPENSDDEDGGAAASPKRKVGGHGRSGSLSRSPGPRSPPPGSNGVRHASLLTDNATKLKAEKERARAEALRDAQRQMRSKGGDDSRDASSNRGADDQLDEDDDERTPTPAKRNGKGAVAVAAAASKKSGRRQSPEHSDDEDAEELDARAQDSRRGGGAGRGRARAESEELSRSESESPPPRSKKAASTPKKGKSSGPSAAWLAAASNSGIPKELPSVSRRARVYALDPEASVDPAVVAIAAKFKAKKNGVVDPHRRLLHQGAMKRQGGWSVVDRWCFLFSDLFMFTEYDAKKGGDYREKQRVHLRFMLVDMRPASFQGESLRQTKLPNAFRILDNNPAGPPVQFVCSTLTPQEKVEWGRRMGEAISKWHANDPDSKVDRTQPGWYTQFVRGMLPHAVIHAEDPDLLLNLLRTTQKDNINDLDQEGNSLLHLCVLNNTPQVIPVLVAHGADLHVRDWDNYTALHVAVVRGNMECVSALLGAKGMAVEVWHPMNPKEPRVLRDQSCLWIAAVTHFQSDPGKADALIRMLIGFTKAAAKDFLDERSEKSDMTLLDYCCFNSGMEAVADTLIQLGATVDLHNLDGLTPLSQACRAGNVPMVALLLRHGAQPNLRHHKHGLNSPLFYCRGSSALECARTLVSSGARWNDGLRNKDGIRVRDLFPSISQQNILKAAEDSWQRAPAVDNSWEVMKPPATAMPQNNRHDFDSCCLCQTDFTLVNKREYCRRCGWNVCGSCCSRRMVFVSQSRGKSRNGASSAQKERVCDGCYNLTAYVAKHGHKKEAAAASSNAKRNGGARADSDDDMEAVAAQFRKPARKQQRPQDDEDLSQLARTRTRSVASYSRTGEDESERGGRGGAMARGGGRRAEPSGFKSIKRLDVESDDDEHSDVDERQRSARKQTARGKHQQTANSESDSDSRASRPDDADSDAAADYRAKSKLAADKAAAAAAASSSSKSQGFGGRLLARFSSKKSLTADVEAEDGSAKNQAAKRNKGRDASDDDEDEDRKRAPAGNNKQARSGKARAADDDEEPPARSGRNGVSNARSRGRGAAVDDDDDDEHTDSDGGGSQSDNPKRGNIFQRGFQSASGAVKSASGAMGGAMSSVARGVSKLAHTVQEKVTAATADHSDEEDEDPMAASRARRKEAARQRLRNRYAADEDDERQIEEQAPEPHAKKAAGTAAKMADAKKQALRNQELLDGMEQKGGEVEEGGREFQSLAAKLKAKSKAQRF